MEGDSPPAISATPSLDQIVEIAHAQLQLAPDQLRGRGRSRYESWCRCLVTTLAVGQFGHRAKDLAEHLNKSSVSVSRWRSEGAQLQVVDPVFRDRLRALRGEIQELVDPPSLVDSP